MNSNQLDGSSWMWLIVHSLPWWYHPWRLCCFLLPSLGRQTNKFYTGLSRRHNTPIRSSLLNMHKGGWHGICVWLHLVSAWPEYFDESFWFGYFKNIQVETINLSDESFINESSQMTWVEKYCARNSKFWKLQIVCKKYFTVKFEFNFTIKQWSTIIGQYDLTVCWTPQQTFNIVWTDCWIHQQTVEINIMFNISTVCWTHQQTVKIVWKDGWRTQQTLILWQTVHQLKQVTIVQRRKDDEFIGAVTNKAMEVEHEIRYFREMSSASSYFSPSRPFSHLESGFWKLLV